MLFRRYSFHATDSKASFWPRLQPATNVREEKGLKRRLSSVHLLSFIENLIISYLPLHSSPLFRRNRSRKSCWTRLESKLRRVCVYVLKEVPTLCECVYFIFFSTTLFYSIPFSFYLVRLLRRCATRSPTPSPTLPAISAVRWKPVIAAARIPLSLILFHANHLHLVYPQTRRWWRALGRIGRTSGRNCCSGCGAASNRPCPCTASRLCASSGRAGRQQRWEGGRICSDADR